MGLADPAPPAASAPAEIATIAATSVVRVKKRFMRWMLLFCFATSLTVGHGKG
jgi:hypothetical protein